MLFSSTEFLIKLADVKIFVDPFHPIKKPVHAKFLFSPAPHFGYQVVWLSATPSIPNYKTFQES
jgi:hypothetical protein